MEKARVLRLGATGKNAPSHTTSIPLSSPPRLFRTPKAMVSAKIFKDQSIDKCPVAFARNWPLECFAQMVPNTYSPLIAKPPWG